MITRDSIAKIWLTAGEICIETTDGRCANESFSEYKGLRDATDEQRGNYRLSRFGIHWPEIDEDLSFEGFFKTL